MRSYSQFQHDSMASLRKPNTNTQGSSISSLIDKAGDSKDHLAKLVEESLHNTMKALMHF